MPLYFNIVSLISKAYTAETIFQTLSFGLSFPPYPTQEIASAFATQLAPKGTGFYTRVPQPLFDALNANLGPDDYQQTQHLDHRHGR